MKLCSVNGCRNGNPSTIDPTMNYYYFFPRLPIYSQKWAQFCGKEVNNLDSATICSLHFDENSYTEVFTQSTNNPMEYVCTKILKMDAIPTLHVPTTYSEKTKKNEETIDLTEPLVENDSEEYIEIHVEGETSSDVGYNEGETPGRREIRSISQLLQFRKESKALQYQVQHYEKNVKDLQNILANKEKELKEKQEVLKNLKKDLSESKQSKIPFSRQNTLLSKVFSNSQLKILSGKKKIYWSDDDMAVANTIRHLSNNRCYEYLIKNLNIPLPAPSSMKRWLAIKGVKQTSKKDMDDSD